MTEVIQTDGLTKTYGKGKPALSNLTLHVEKGEIFGYLGPNGSGKTTTIRLLLDIIRPTTGTAQLFGQDAQQHSVALHKRIGFLPGELNLWKHYTGLEVVKYLAKLRGMSDLSYAHQLAERLGLDFKLRVRSYSTGNKRKLGLVIALMHQPELVILDEPTSGLDPLIQQTFYELMHETRAAGRTVFLSSHILTEVQAICDRVGILRNGDLKAVESVEKLTRADFRWVTLRLRENPPAAVFSRLANVTEVAHEDGTIKLRLSGDFDPFLRIIQPYYVTDLKVEEPSLEDIFLAYYDNSADNKA